MSTQDLGADCIVGYECVAWSTDTGRSSFTPEWSTYDACIAGCHVDGPGFYVWRCTNGNRGQGYRSHAPLTSEVCSSSALTAGYPIRCFNGTSFFCCGCL